MPIENFKGKQNSNGLDKNKDNINYNGRPKKMISGVIADMKAEGYNATTPEEVQDIYLMLVQLSDEDFATKLAHKDTPKLVKIVGTALEEGKGFEVIEKMFDRAMGKSVQRTEERQVDKDGNDILTLDNAGY